MKKNVLAFILLLILTLIAFELNFYRTNYIKRYEYYYAKVLQKQLQMPNEPNEFGLGKILPHFSGRLISGQYIRTSEFSSNFILLIFFNQLDCPDCLIESIVWNSVHNSFPDSIVKVVGIANGISASHLIKYIKEKQFDFPVIYDKEDSLKSKLKITITPLRVILDRNFRILDIEKPTERNLITRTLINKIARLTKNYY